jgi:hypothetical protein
MKKKNLLILSQGFFCTALIMLLMGCLTKSDEAEPEQTSGINPYTQEIQDILLSNCSECHTDNPDTVDGAPVDFIDSASVVEWIQDSHDSIVGWKQRVGIQELEIITEFFASIRRTFYDSLYPADNDTNIPINANLVIAEYDRIIKPDLGNITIRLVSDNSIFETIDSWSANVTGIGTSIVTIDPSGIFASHTEYYVQIDPTAFADSWGVTYQGISDSDTWNFTTGATTIASSFSEAEEQIKFRSRKIE